MAFDFPASPTVGQIYAPAGGPSYTYNGVGWLANPQTVVGWRPIARIKPTTDVASASFLIPSDLRTLRLSGVALMNGSGVPLGLQYSTDGGGTWLTTSQYVRGAMYYAGSVGGGYVADNYMRLIGSADQLIFARGAVSMLLALPTASERGVGHGLSHDWSNASYKLAVNAMTFGTAFLGPVTHGRIVSQSGDVVVGNDIVVEGL